MKRKDAFETVFDNFKNSSDMLARKLEMRLGAVDSALFFEEDKTGFDLWDTELAALYKAKLAPALQIVFENSTPRKSRRHIKAYSSALSVADTVAIARMLYEKADADTSLTGYALLENEGDTELPEDLRIVYRKARGADIAFEKFASLIHDAAAIYRDTFPTVCDAVAIGEADMCILPYENSDDGKLNSFYRLIEKYELKIAASCSVKSVGREDITRYLLLSKNLSGLTAISGVTDFEFLLSDRADSTLTRAMTAAHLLGLEIRSIDTVVTENKLTVFDIRVASSAKTLDEYILYLKLEQLDFSPLGLFAQID